MSSQRVREATALVTDLCAKLSGPREMTEEEAIEFFARIIEDLEPRIDALRDGIERERVRK